MPRTKKTETINIKETAQPKFVSVSDELRIELEDKVKELKDTDKELYSYITTLHDTAQTAISKLVEANNTITQELEKLNVIVTILAVCGLCLLVGLLKCAL